MNKSVASLLFLFLSVNIYSQDCPAEEVFFIQDGDPLEGVSSDLFAYPLNATIAADNFILDVAAEVNTVCWPGFYWYEGDGVGTARDMVHARAEICDVENKNFRITYYNDGGGIPGNVTYTEDVVPTLIPNNVTLVEHYYYSATHANVPIPANVTHWVSIQNIDDDGCNFHLIVGTDLPPPPEAQRQKIQTRTDGGYAINTTGNWQPVVGQGGCINLVLGAVALPPIPTMSQWGVFILGLLVMIFGASWIRSSIKIAE